MIFMANKINLIEFKSNIHKEIDCVDIIIICYIICQKFFFHILFYWYIINYILICIILFYYFTVNYDTIYINYFKYYNIILKIFIKKFKVKF